MMRLDIDSIVKLWTTPITASSPTPIRISVTVPKTAKSTNQIMAQANIKRAGDREPPVVAIRTEPTKAPPA